MEQHRFGTEGGKYATYLSTIVKDIGLLGGTSSLEMRLVSLWTNLSSRKKKKCERVLSQ